MSAGGDLYFVDYSLSQAFFDYQITVKFRPDGTSLVVFFDGKRVVNSNELSSIANRLKAIPWGNVPLTISGEIRPITDLGVLTVTAYSSDGVYQIKRDLRIKGDNDGDFQRVKRIFNLLFDKLEKSKAFAAWGTGGQ